MVVVCVLAAASLFFFDRMLWYQEAAEKSAVDITVMHLRNGLRYRTAEMLLQHQDKEVVNLIGANPMQWVDMPPPTYMGELRQPQWDRIAPGSWYFDGEKGELVYRIKRGQHFNSGTSSAKMLRFRVIANYRKTSADQSAILAEGLQLLLLEPYRWF